MRTIFSLRLAATVLTVVAMLNTPMGPDMSVASAAQPRPVPVSMVKLTASPAASSFLLGDPVAIQVQLSNGSGSSLGLSDLPDGNLVVTSFQCNGAPVATVGSETFYGDGMPAALSSSLRNVSAGGSLSYLWQSNTNADLGGQALRETKNSGADFGKGTHLSLARVGSYSLTFYYEYTGPAGTFPGAVFRGKTNSVTVTFQVI